MIGDAGLALSIMIGVIVAATAIDSRSLWIDEFGTWLISEQPSFSRWWADFVHYPDSDGQLPFYHLYIYFWSSVFGTSEVALRGANLPWLVLAFWAISRSALPKPVRWLWICMLSLHSFTWYYLNEARPYILFISGSALTCCAWTHLLQGLQQKHSPDLREGIAFYCVGSLLLLGGSILGALWVASTALTLLWLFRDRLSVLLGSLRSSWLLVLLCVIAAAFIVGIAFNSFLHGARPAPLKFSIFGIGYGFIELLGMAGLGPGRNELRDGFHSISVAELLPMLTASSVAVSVAVWSALQIPRRYLWPSLAALIAPLLILAGLGEIISMRVVGRHFAVLVLPFTLGYAYWVYSVSGSALGKTFAAVLISCLIISSLLVRFSDRHRKDDYATAAAVACRGLQPGDVVWWVADPRGAAYYGVLSMSALRAEWGRNTDGHPIVVGCDAAHRQDTKTALASPKRIIYSKPDLYDQGNRVDAYIKRNGLHREAQFSAFSVFRAE